MPEVVGILRRASPHGFLIDNLAWGQVRDKCGGVDKAPFSTSFKPNFDPFSQGFFVKPQSERIESATFAMNLLIYYISCFQEFLPEEKRKI